MGQIVIRLTESAYVDLESIEDYISQDSPAVARKFISRIFDKIEQLKLYPFSGKRVLEFNNNSLRELLLHKYRIIYLVVDENEIHVIRIVHGSRLLDIEF